MRFSILCLLFALAILPLQAKGPKKRTEITFETTMGNIVVALYNETPLHRDNMIKKVKHKAYDGLLFHRVIRDFMIQGGDNLSKNAAPGVLLGDGDEKPSDWIPAEFCYPQIFHKRGALAAAREGNDVNPDMKSSSWQFYIVWGKTFDDAAIEAMQKRLGSRKANPITMPQEIIDVYKKEGGTPHLDGNYTVFGEVLSGMDVVDLIQNVETDGNDRPVSDIKIIKARITRK